MPWTSSESRAVSTQWRQTIRFFLLTRIFLGTGSQFSYLHRHKLIPGPGQQNTMSSTFLHNIGASVVLFMAGSSGHFNAAAHSAPVSGSAAATGEVSDLPHDRWSYDQVTAQIPRKEAPIASVALAKINISLHKARRKAEQKLCAGQWTPQGPVLHQQGPALEQASSAQGHANRFWHYNALRSPPSLSCSAVSRARFYLEMSRHLPEWVQIRPAGLNFAFQQGQAVLVQQTVVTRATGHSY